MSIFKTLCVLPVLGLVILHDCPATQTNLTGKEEAGSALAKLSYVSSYLADDNRPGLSPQICFELYRDGHYRESRTAKGITENVRGTLSQDEFNLVTKMLAKLDFANKGGSVILKGSESFVAETARGDEMKRYIWIDADHQRPFPESAASIIDWLQAFKPHNASPLAVSELSADPICPRMSDNPVQPISPPSIFCR